MEVSTGGTGGWGHAVDVRSPCPLEAGPPAIRAQSGGRERGLGPGAAKQEARALKILERVSVFPLPAHCRSVIQGFLLRG